MSLGLRSHNFGYARAVYHRLYTKDSPDRSNNPIYAHNPFISRTLPKFFTPPRTALFVKSIFARSKDCWAPQVLHCSRRFKVQTVVEESFRLAVRDYSGPGVSEDDPMVLVVGVEDADKRSASTAQSGRLPEAVLPEPRNSTFQNVVNNPCLLVQVHYTVASDEDGALAFKMSFDP